jgi:hypothetical protein
LSAFAPFVLKLFFVAAHIIKTAGMRVRRKKRHLKDSARYEEARDFFLIRRLDL